ncbi:MAG: thioredoxin [Patescibacteria group bacterium]|jgi:thioredoxin 1
MAEVILTDANFEEEVLKNAQPVLVDFWAEWCGPCRIQGPIVEELAEEFAGKAKVAKIEVDAHPQHPQQYGVMSIPTIALFKDGKIVWQAVGVQEKSTMAEQITKALG